ncbi:MAG: hypothetical protein RL638_766 [Bacteroidota bacterium]|jgi:hypothetical protein
MNEIYQYIDDYGIPIVHNSNIEIRIQNNENDILQKIELENDPSLDKILSEGSIIISQHSHYRKVEPNFPNEFNLSTEEQINLVLEWFKDTTGFIISDFNTLLELPVLPNSKTPFLLLVESENLGLRLVLAKKIINGDLEIKKKYTNDGWMLRNWITTLGRISIINGNLYIDNEMDDLGDLEIVNGNVSFSNYVYQNKLVSLAPLKRVNGDLYLKNTYASLGTIEYVKGNLNLRKTTVKDLGSLNTVEGNILVSKSQKDRYNFDNINVKGKIRYYNDVFNEGELTLPQ